LFHYGPIDRKTHEIIADYLGISGPTLEKAEAIVKAAEEICRNAIEKYYGKNVLERFGEKEKESKGKLGNIYEIDRVRRMSPN